MISLLIHLTQPFSLSPRHLLTRNVGGGGSSHQLAPNPDTFTEPVIQVYAARTRGAKGRFAVHTWVATKKEGDQAYNVSQIIGWARNEVGTSLFSQPGVPDKGWYGNPPMLLLDLRGSEYEVIIDKIDNAIQQYPWASEYATWPGPNSNTFIAWLGIQVPELGLDLPSTAIGKDWRPIGQSIGFSPSGSGLQFSLFGLVGTTLGIEEGIEFNFLGLSFELDLFDLALELPTIGRIGSDPVD